MPVDNRPVHSWQSQAPCGENLPLVDAAFDRPGGPAAKELKRDYCSRCPVGKDCLLAAMLSRQFGVWGGTGPNLRTRHGAPPKPGTKLSADRARESKRLPSRATA